MRNVSRIDFNSIPLAWAGRPCHESRSSALEDPTNQPVRRFDPATFFEMKSRVSHRPDARALASSVSERTISRPLGVVFLDGARLSLRWLMVCLFTAARPRQLWIGDAPGLEAWRSSRPRRGC